MNICHDFRYGKITYNVLDEYVGKSLKLYGEYSQGEADLFEQLLHPDDVVIEVGANIGAHTVHLAQSVKRGKVLAFEPQRLVFQLLNANVALNSLTNVYCYQKCVSDEGGWTNVPELSADEKHNWGGVSLENEHVNGELVEKITLDSLKLTKCNFIKLDVEGMELNVLQGAEQLIDECQPIIYTEMDRLDKKKPLLDFLLKKNYVIHEHNVPLFNEDNYFCNKENEFVINGKQICSFNALCLPKNCGIIVETK